MARHNIVRTAESSMFVSVGDGETPLHAPGRKTLPPITMEEVDQLCAMIPEHFAHLPPPPEGEILRIIEKAGVP